MTSNELAALHAACFTTPRPWSAAEFSDLLAANNVFLVTGEGPSFALGRALAGETELLTLAVAPEARGRKLGRLALQAYEAEALTRGAEDAFLEVASTNKIAISLYVSEGYRESGRRKNYYSAPDGTKIDALVFTKRIKQS